METGFTTDERSRWEDIRIKKGIRVSGYKGIAFEGGVLGGGVVRWREWNIKVAKYC